MKKSKEKRFVKWMNNDLNDINDIEVRYFVMGTHRYMQDVHFGMTSKRVEITIREIE